jgi:hypothetical protein
MPPTGCAGRSGDADTKHAPVPATTDDRPLATIKITNYGWSTRRVEARTGLGTGDPKPQASRKIRGGPRGGSGFRNAPGATPNAAIVSLSRNPQTPTGITPGASKPLIFPTIGEPRNSLPKLQPPPTALFLDRHPHLLSSWLPSSRPIASAATACIVAVTCEYKSKVMPIWLWPSRSLTILGCTPSLNSNVAQL